MSPEKSKALHLNLYQIHSPDMSLVQASVEGEFEEENFCFFSVGSVSVFSCGRFLPSSILSSSGFFTLFVTGSAPHSFFCFFSLVGSPSSAPLFLPPVFASVSLALFFSFVFFFDIESDASSLLLFVFSSVSPASFFSVVFSFCTVPTFFFFSSSVFS